MTQPLPHFDDLADTFLSLGTINSPAELHGLLCGRLAGGMRYENAEWEDTAWEFLDPVHPPEPDAHAQIGSLYVATLGQFQDVELGFQLLLPDDEVELSQRLAALGQWCHGFLSGFGSSGISGDHPMSAEAAEILRDFTEIAQISEGEEDSEDGEADFINVAEHVIMGAVSLFLEMNRKDEDTVH